MLRRWLLSAGGALLVLVVAPVAWYLLSPLFITRTVNEELPVAQAAMQPVVTEVVSSTSTADLPPTPTDLPPTTAPGPSAAPSQAASTSIPTDLPPTAAPSPSAAPSPPASTPTPTVSNAPVALKRGQFHAVTHEGEGTATVYELPDGQRVLRLEDFAVLNGPDLFVWLSSAADANNARTILDSQYVELGPLKGNQGNQNYTLPADLDLSNYRSVTIWCRQFSVNFATAPLQ